jgi:hypothetical protein
VGTEHIIEPVLDYVIGQDATWQSAFLFSAGARWLSTPQLVPVLTGR